MSKLQGIAYSVKGSGFVCHCTAIRGRDKGIVLDVHPQTCPQPSFQHFQLCQVDEKAF